MLTFEDFETETEREEREAVESGQFETVEIDESEFEVNICCPNPIVAARKLCGCGGLPYL